VEAGAGFAHRVAGKGYGKSARQNQYGVSCTKCKDRYDQKERRQQDFLRGLQEDYKRRTTKMKTEHATLNHNPPRTLSFLIGALNAKIGWVARIAEKIDEQVIGTDENDPDKTRADALPPRWPGAYLAKAPSGLKAGACTTLVKGWHDKWLCEVEERQQTNPLLLALMDMYLKALAEVEDMLSQDLVPLEESILEVQPPKTQTPY
jgi:hypothetical protein